MWKTSTNCKNKEILFVRNTALSHSNCAESHLDNKNVINFCIYCRKVREKIENPENLKVQKAYMVCLYYGVMGTPFTRTEFCTQTYEITVFQKFKLCTLRIKILEHSMLFVVY